MAHSIHEVADYFIEMPDADSGDFITHLKLQKLCYYAQAWYLALNNERLINGEFQAWPHGPVNTELWARFREKNWQPILQSEVKAEGFSFHEQDLSFLGVIWDIYGPYTAKALEDMTHDELPWIEARKGLSPYESSRNPISDETMRTYYAARAAT